MKLRFTYATSAALALFAVGCGDLIITGASAQTQSQSIQSAPDKALLETQLQTLLPTYERLKAAYLAVRVPWAKKTAEISRARKAKDPAAEASARAERLAMRPAYIKARDEFRPVAKQRRALIRQLDGLS